MRAKRVINEILSLLDVQLVSLRRVGLNCFTELDKTGIRIKTVFDVGANIGQSSSQYLQMFPEAKVHAFEPVSSNFAKLDSILNPRLIRNHCAVGAESGEMKVYLSENSGKHSSVVINNATRYERVEKITIDHYCETVGVSQIGLLKVDTEGGDLDVLRGAELLLSNQAIDFILVETAFYAKQRHVHICDFLRHLAPRDYHVFGVYDQSLEWNGSARVQYANLLFARTGIQIAAKTQ